VSLSLRVSHTDLDGTSCRKINVQSKVNFTHLLRDLRWLRVPERIQFPLAVLAFCCRNHKAPSYLADDLHWTDEAESRHRLRSGSCPRLIVPRTRLSTIGDRSFRVTVAQAWNSLPTNVTASTSLPSFKRELKTFFIYQIFPITLNCFLIFLYRVLEAT